MHACPKCAAECDCDRGLPGCEHLCLQLAEKPLTRTQLKRRRYLANRAKRRAEYGR